MAPEQTKVVPLTCHGHSRPITHLSFSSIGDGDQYYLITACKDNNPILRDGITGDWIGTFIGHKGAVWSARLSSDAKLAATGSADFSAKIWDTHTGETLHTLQHNHIVRAVAFPPGPSPRIVATGGAEKRLRIWNISSRQGAALPNGNQASDASTPITPKVTEASDPSCYEIGEGVHTGTIKSILFTPDNPNVLITAAEDKKVRWWDLTTRRMIAEFAVDGNIGSSELTAVSAGPMTNGVSSTASHASTEPILSIAATKHVYFLSGSASRPATLLKKLSFKQDMSCAALSPPAPAPEVEAVPRQLVTGSANDTWVHLFSYDEFQGNGEAAAESTELEIGKGHHGPVWSAAFSPDGRLYATGSEDGTVKLWKVGGAGTPGYGLWR